MKNLFGRAEARLRTFGAHEDSRLLEPEPPKVALRSRGGARRTRSALRAGAAARSNTPTAIPTAIINQLSTLIRQSPLNTSPSHTAYPTNTGPAKRGPFAITSRIPAPSVARRALVAKLRAARASSALPCSVQATPSLRDYYVDAAGWSAALEGGDERPCPRPWRNPCSAVLEEESMTKIEQTQVLIAGGGPVGLLAAVCAARRGLDVIVFERSFRGTPRGHATLLHPSSMRLLAELGLAPLLLRSGQLIEQIELRVSSHTLLLKLPFPAVIITQSVFEEALLQVVRKEEIDLRAPCEVVAIAQREQHVEVRVARREHVDATALRDQHWELADSSLIHTQFVIGADGRTSHVMHSLGIHAASSPAERYAMFEVPSDHSPPTDASHLGQTQSLHEPLGRSARPLQLPTRSDGERDGRSVSLGDASGRARATTGSAARAPLECHRRLRTRCRRGIRQGPRVACGRCRPHGEPTRRAEHEPRARRSLATRRSNGRGKRRQASAQCTRTAGQRAAPRLAGNPHQ